MTRYILSLLLLLVVPVGAQETDTTPTPEPELVVEIPEAVVEQLRHAKAQADRAAADVRAAYGQEAPPSAPPPPPPVLSARPPVMLIPMMDPQDQLDACLEGTRDLEMQVKALKAALRSVSGE